MVEIRPGIIQVRVCESVSYDGLVLHVCGMGSAWVHKIELSFRFIPTSFGSLVLYILVHLVLRPD
jgi:hypothetical protein